jgi:hypothetical protein
MGKREERDTSLFNPNPHYFIATTEATAYG